MIDDAAARVITDFKRTMDRLSPKYISNNPEKLLRQFEANYDKLDIAALIQMTTQLPGFEKKVAQIMARKEMQLDD